MYGMAMMHLIVAPLVLGLAYLIWIEASREKGALKLIGQLLVALIILSVALTCVTGKCHLRGKGGMKDGMKKGCPCCSQMMKMDGKTGASCGDMKMEAPAKK